MSGKRWEKTWPHLFAVIIGIAVYFLYPHVNARTGSLELLLATAVTFAGVIVGFIAAIKTILFSMKESRPIRKLRDGKEFNLLICYGMSSMHAGLVFGAIGLAGIALDLSTTSLLNKIWAVLAASSGAWAILCTYRFILVMTAILRD